MVSKAQAPLSPLSEQEVSELSFNAAGVRVIKT